MPAARCALSIRRSPPLHCFINRIQLTSPVTFSLSSSSLRRGHSVAMSSSSSSSPSPPAASSAQLRSALSAVIPSLSSSSHKGQAGRLCVVGGSAAYTGAPYFSAMTTLKLGADLVTVLCSVEAAVPIKSYSPELMTRPTLIPQHLLEVDGVNPHVGKGKGGKRSEVISSIVQEARKEVLDKCQAVIVGPGLGKDEMVLDTAAALLRHCRSASLPIVLDGDGINIAVQHLDVVRGYSRAVLTPNAAEFRRLWEAALPGEEAPPLSLPVDEKLLAFMSRNSAMEGGFLELSDPMAAHTARLASALAHCTVVRKGPVDVISDGRIALYCCRQGAPRRCGGQGDVLTGAIGTVLAWAGIHSQQQQQEEGGDGRKEKKSRRDKEGGEGGAEDSDALSAELLAAYSGCLLVRQSAESAFRAHGRSMLASHVMDGMEAVIEDIAPVRSKI